MRCACRIDCRIVFSLARCRTIWLRLVTCRRNAQRRLIRYPNLGQEAARVSRASTVASMTSVLIRALAIRSHLARIGDHHPADIRARPPRLLLCIAGRLDDNVVICVSFRRTPPDGARHANSAQPDSTLSPSIITASAKTRWISNPIARIAAPSRVETGAGGQHGNYGSALAAHPGEPQGRPNKGSGSQPMV